VNCWLVPTVTVIDAVPVTTVPAFEYSAVIVTAPFVTAVASPVAALIVAIDGLLELHATWPVRFTVAPDEVVPIARNCVVCPAADTDCELGIIATETTLPPATPPPDEVTVMMALEEMGPLNPAALAVIVVVPAPTAVASPPELTVATDGELELQVTAPVITCEEA
jgi:hypothetical protein